LTGQFNRHGNVTNNMGGGILAVGGVSLVHNTSLATWPTRIS
jgi:hypothetical protein